MTRPVYIFLPVLLAAAWILSACQPENNPAPTQAVRFTSSVSPQKETQKPTIATATSGPSATPLPKIELDSKQLQGVEVLFWHPWSGETARVVSDLADEFNRENVWGVKIVVGNPGGNSELFEQVLDSQKNGKPPALVAAPVDRLLYWQLNGGGVVDLNAYVADANWGLSSQEIQDFIPLFWQQDEQNGQRLGIPAQRSARILFYNQTWARELGFSTPPNTPTEFQKQACAAAKANNQDGPHSNDGTGGWIFDQDAMTLMSWMQAFGSTTAVDPTQSYRFNTPETARSFDFLRKMFDLGCAWSSRNPLPYEYFASRQALFYSGDLTDIQTQEHTQERLNSRDEWQILPFPSQTAQPFMLANGPDYAILRSTPTEEMAAWLFIRWMILPRNQVRLAQAGDMLPVSTSALNGSIHSPHWQKIVDSLTSLRTAPAIPGWWASSRVLEDAGWQILQLTPQPAAKLLQQLDDTIPEILNHQP